MEKVIGLKVLIEANTGTDESPDYTVVAGQRDASINLTGDAIDTSSKDGDGWKTSQTGLLGWDADFDGVIVDTNAGLAAIETAFNTGAALLCRLVFPDGTRRRGLARVTSMPIKAPMAGEATYSVKMQGTGKLELDTATIDAPVIENPTQGQSPTPLNTVANCGENISVTNGADTRAAMAWQLTTAADPNFLTPVIDLIKKADSVNFYERYYTFNTYGPNALILGTDSKC